VGEGGVKVAGIDAAGELLLQLGQLAVEALHVFAFAGAPRPLAGWARAGWHVETLFVMGWPAAVAACCWATKDKRPGVSRAVEVCGIRPGSPAQAPGLAFNSLLGHPRAREFLRLRASRTLWLCSQAVNGSSRTHPLDVLLGCYLGLLVSLVLAYPLPRARLRWLFLAWEVACVALAWAGLYRARLRPWGPVERCFVILAACETMVATVGPFASDPFTRWWIGGCFYLGAWSGVGAVLARGQGAIPTSHGS
jgi:hypothetical protein